MPEHHRLGVTVDRKSLILTRDTVDGRSSYTLIKTDLDGKTQPERLTGLSPALLDKLVHVLREEAAHG